MSLTDATTEHQAGGPSGGLPSQGGSRGRREVSSWWGTVVPVSLIAKISLTAGIVLLVLFPMFASNYLLTIATAIGIGVIGAVPTNLLIGVANQASIGNAAFMAIGAFVAAQTVTSFHLPIVVTVLFAGIAAGIVGMIIAIPAARVKGLYLIIATLALHYVTLYFLTTYQSDNVGIGGFVMPELQIGSMSTTISLYVIAVVGALLAVYTMRNLLSSRFGRSWYTLARDEIAAGALGVNVFRQKVIAFGFTSFVIGVQGALYGYYIGVVSVDLFTFDLAVSYIAMIVIGGLGSPAGSVVGAAFVIGLPYVVTEIADQLPASFSATLSSRIFDIETLLYGLAIVGFLLFEPLGLVYIGRRIMVFARRRTSAVPRRPGQPTSTESEGM